MMDLIQLWNAPKHQLAEVAALDELLNPLIKNRLREMGLEQGQALISLGRGPFNGPLIVQVQDCVYSLEQNIAQQVFVQLSQ